jgi:CheY-like chemotaxis protein
VKPTATCPVTVELISQLKLPEVIDEHSSNNKLLVVICLASYAREPSNYAGMMAEKAQAELMKRYRGNPLPVRFVSVELSELGLVAEQYGIREIPYCLMFLGGHLVHSKKLSGMKMTLRDGFTSRPSILLVESNPAAQLKLERTLRRNGYNSDLALDVPMALRLASRQTPYGVLLISSALRVDQIRSIVSAVRRQQPKALILAYNSNMPSDEDVEVRKRFLDECTHVFLHIPGISALAAVLSRFDVTRTTFPHVGDNKMDFVEEILGVVERGHGPGPEQSPVPVHG